MLLQGAYTAGFERQSFSAFGLPLAPLTLGHVQLLAQMGAKFPFDSSSLEKADLCYVLAVCVFPKWQQASEVLSANEGHVEQIAQHVIGEKSGDLKDVASYLSYYLQRPKSRGGRDPYDCRVPWWWAYAEFLQSEMGRSEECAWDTICCDAFCYYACYASRSGDEQFLTLREAYLDDMVASGKTIKQMFEEGLI